jgi:multidrug efflux pump subunit AcrB
MRAFIRYFAERSTLANVITLMIVFLGLSALTIIQRDNFPSVDFDEMVITTRYPGASSEDVELNVTNKIEEELKEVDGLDTVNSFSMENISVIKLKLDADSSDKDKVKSDVRDAVSRVSDLPTEVDEKPLVDDITTATGIPIIEVGLTGEVEYKTLREWAGRIEKALQNVTGVASLRKYGYLDREIKIEVAQDAMERFQIPTQDIVAAISNRNIRSTGGSFESYTHEKKIVTLAQFQDPLEVGDVILRANSGGTFLRVHDLAILQDGFEPAKVLSRMNGKSAISFLVYKKESADIIRTIDAVKSLVERYQAHMPEGISIDFSNDTSRLVRNRLAVVSTNGLLGLLLVLVVLATFLNLRSAVWVAMGIPVSLLGTLFFLPMFGAYLDSISLAAMILVIGIIVDDGIVIAENIWRHMEEGMAPLDAAVEGTVAVFQPVLATILTTALAFAPMFFMSGTMGSFIYVIPLVVMLALVISFIEISLALPAHLIAGAKALSGSVQESNRQGFFRRMQEQFGRFLQRLIRMRYAVIGLFLTLLLTAFWYAGRYMDFVLFPTQSADTIYLTVELDSGSSLEHTAEKLREVERAVLDLPEEERDSFVTRIGSHGDFSMGENENWALLGIYLTPFSERSRNADQIVEFTSVSPH